MYTNEFKIGIKIGSQGPIEIPFLILRRVYGKNSVLVKKCFKKEYEELCLLLSCMSVF